MLTKELFLSKKELKKKKIKLSFGETMVREMTAKEKDVYERLLVDVDDSGVIHAKREHWSSKLAICTLCDDDGNLLFDENDLENLAENISAADMNIITTEASKLNGLDRQKDKEKN